MPDDFAVDDSLAAAIMSHADSLEMQLDMSEGMLADDIIDIDAPNDTISMSGRDWNSWRPNPQRAMWLAIVLPWSKPALSCRHHQPESGAPQTLLHTLSLVSFLRSMNACLSSLPFKQRCPAVVSES